MATSLQTLASAVSQLWPGYNWQLLRAAFGEELRLKVRDGKDPEKCSYTELDGHIAGMSHEQAGRMLVRAADALVEDVFDQWFDEKQWKSLAAPLHG